MAKAKKATSGKGKAVKLPYVPKTHQKPFIGNVHNCPLQRFYPTAKGCHSCQYLFFGNCQ
jgi:hypothetical protein